MAGDRTLEAAIFDMDGVLIDSEPLWRDVEAEVFSRVGVHLTPGMLRRTMGMRIGEVVDHWFERHPWEGVGRPEVADRIIDGVADAIRDRGILMDGAREAVAFFEDHGLRLALASSSSPRLIEAALEATELVGRFEAVRSAEADEHGKPHPAVFLGAAAALGVDPARCVAIEDSPAGVRSAKAAGMVCVAVPEPGAGDGVRAAGADVVLGSLREIDDGIWDAIGVARKNLDRDRRSEHGA